MDKIKYKKLPGRGVRRGPASLFIRCSARLWLGPDHILSQYSMGFNEEYKRFYFGDIQAIALSKTNRGRIINSILISIIVLIALLYGLSLMTHDSTNTFIYLFIGGVFLVPVVINTMLGPTSKGYLITAVTKEELPSLIRMRKALKVINTLRLHIERAQGRISREELAGGLAVSSQASGPQAQKTHVRDAGPRLRQSGSAPSSLASEESKYNSYKGKFHIVLFILFLVAAFMSAADLMIVSIPLSLLSILLMFIISIFVVICLVKQQGSSISKGLKNSTWGALIYLVLSYFLGIPVYMYMMISQKIDSEAITQWQQIISIATYPADQDMFLTTLSVFFILVSLSLGTVGMLAYLRNRRASLKTRAP